MRFLSRCVLHFLSMKKLDGIKDGVLIYIYSMKKISLFVALFFSLAMMSCGDHSSSVDFDDVSVQTSSSKNPLSSSAKTSNSLSSKRAQSSSSLAPTSVSNKLSSSGKNGLSSGEIIKSCSSKVVESSSSDSLAIDDGSIVKPDGYYAKNCPEGMECKYVSTEFLNKDMLDSGLYGEYLDARDGQVYKVVHIQYGEWEKDQVWFAQNLNYAYNQPTSTLDSSSFCMNDVADSCARYGRLYLWSAAMDSAGVLSGTANHCGIEDRRIVCSEEGTVRGVCPEGFRLPTENDFYEFYRATGGYDRAGKNNRIRSLWRFNDYGYGGNEGLDLYGFSILPSGYRNGKGTYETIRTLAYFWTSSIEYSGDKKIDILVTRVEFKLEQRETNMFDDAYSVRCIQD